MLNYTKYNLRTTKHDIFTESPSMKKKKIKKDY